MNESLFCGVPLSKLDHWDVQTAMLDGIMSTELAQAIEDYHNMKTKEFTNDSKDKIAIGGIKYDGGKAPIFRGAVSYFPRAIEAVASVSAFGASKYAWKGWESVDDGYNRYSDAMVRHLAYEGKGEVLDPDSGLLHAAHAAWNALARLELLIKERENDDRT